MKIPSWLKTIIVLVIVLAIAYIFKINEFLLIILTIIGFSVYRIYKSRHSILDACRIIETQIWKKPLDKDMWEKGELKNMKIKFVWGKKKNETKN